MTDLELLELARKASENSYSPYSKFPVVSEGKRTFTRIAVWGNSRDYCYPCGSCRQVLSEFGRNIKVICGRGDGAYMSASLSEMMPFAFDF